MGKRSSLAIAAGTPPTSQSKVTALVTTHPHYYLLSIIKTTSSTNCKVSQDFTLRRSSCPPGLLEVTRIQKPCSMTSPYTDYILKRRAKPQQRSSFILLYRYFFVVVVGFFFFFLDVVIINSMATSCMLNQSNRPYDEQLTFTISGDIRFVIKEVPDIFLGQDLKKNVWSYFAFAC